jgi:hypothetical protein
MSGLQDTEAALRAARQGAPHEFRYVERLLKVDIASWMFYTGPIPCRVHIWVVCVQLETYAVAI